jgi:predicted secreted protein
MKKILLFITAFLFSFSVFAAENTPAVSSPKNKIVVTSEKPEFSIVLKSNPTTGYTWRVAQMDALIIKNTGHTYVAPNSKLMGASGYDVWTFKAIYPTTYKFRVNQVGHVVMEYKRPWMKTEKPAMVQHFTVVLKK